MPSNSIKVSQNGEMLTSGNYELVLESELYSFIIPNANGEKELEIILEGVVNPISNEPQIFKFEQR